MSPYISLWSKELASCNSEQFEQSTKESLPLVITVSFFSGNEILYENCWTSKNNHSIELIDSIKNGFIETNLNQADFDCIAVAIGPGGFSSIRVGMSLSLGLSKNNNLKIIGMPTFEIELESHKDSNNINNLQLEYWSSFLDYSLKNRSSITIWKDSYLYLRVL